jgi:hypothetical protein
VDPGGDRPRVGGGDHRRLILVGHAAPGRFGYTAGILAVMPPDAVPPEIRAIADARADARRARDWATADRLKDELESAGWRVVDAASLYTLERAAPPDVEVDGAVRYGSTASVPSRLDDAPIGVATVVIAATDDVAGAIRQAEAVAESAPDGTQIVIVANAPSHEDGDGLAALARLDAADPGAPGVVTEVVRTATRLGAAAAWNVGLRRAAAPVVVLLRPGIVAPAGLVPAIAEALDDPSVAVAGPSGLVSDDLRAFRAAPRDAVDVDAVAGDAIGFRRTDAAARGLLDERFVAPDHLGTWWSLVLRDPPDEEDVDAEPRRAVQVPVEMVSAHDVPAAGDADPARARLAKRNFYRFLKRFATRRDLIGGAARRGD